MNPKVNEILNRIRLKLRFNKNDTAAGIKDNRTPVNVDKTDPLFPTSPNATLPITGPQQGMISTRHR
jgi:hypothetical protein